METKPGPIPPEQDAARPFAGLRPAPLVALYLACVLAPLVLAAAALPREEPFWRELAAAAGLVGLPMLLVQFVLSGRFKWVSGGVGIDLTMRFHQLAARALAVLIVLHPLFLAFPALYRNPAVGLERLAAFLAAPSLTTGVAAWVLALLLIAAGLWRRRLPMPYEAWRLTHGLAAVALAALAGQHAVRVGAYSATAPVAALWAALLAVALGSFAYVYLVRPLALWRRPYRVEAVDRVAAGIWEVVVRPARGARFGFEPGQFAWVSFGAFPLPGFDHPFSVASSPAQLPEVRFLIKESGDFTRRLAGLRPGTRAFLDGPHGGFTLRDRQAASLCLIAGGIGIAPILGILRQLDAARDPRPIALVIAAQSADELVYTDEIDAIATRLDLTVTRVLEHPPAGWTGRSGVVDRATVDAGVRCAHPARCLALVCGPTTMMVTASRHLRAAGLPARRIVYERFVFD